MNRDPQLIMVLDAADLEALGMSNPDAVVSLHLMMFDGASDEDLELWCLSHGVGYCLAGDEA